MCAEVAKSLIDVDTLAAAMKLSVEPIITAQTREFKSMRDDVEKRHKENLESRHSAQNKNDTAINALGLQLIDLNLRTTELELKVKLAVGPDGNEGAIAGLKRGQDAQLAALTVLQATVTQISQSLPSLLEVAQQVSMEKAARARNRTVVVVAKDWADVVLKFAAVCSGVYWAIQYVARH